MIIEGGNDALRLDINVDRYGKPVKVRDLRNLILRVTHHQCVILYNLYKLYRINYII